MKTKPALSQIMKAYSLEYRVDEDLLPKPKSTLQITEKISIPLYGSLIGVEVELIKEFRTIRDQLLKKVQAYMDRLDTIYPSAFKTSLKQHFAIESLTTGDYIICPESYLDFPEELSESLVLFDDLAKAYGIEPGSKFLTLYPVVDGVVDDRLRSVAENMDDFMLSIGVQGETLLDRMNSLLTRQPLVDLSLSESPSVSDIDSGLTPEEVAYLNYLISDDCLSSVLLAARLGNFALDFIAYLPVESIDPETMTKERLITALMSEVQPLASTAPTEVNKNRKSTKKSDQATEIKDGEEKK